MQTYLPLAHVQCGARQSCARQLLARALALALAMLALGDLAGASIQAQAVPPDRFYGVVTIDGKEQGEGTVVEAFIGNTLCGSGTVQERDGRTIYLVDVVGAGQKQGCAKDGDTVKFRVAGLNAKETATYQTGVATRLDLTAQGTPRRVSEPTVLPASGGGTPAPATVIAPPSPSPAPGSSATSPAGVTESATPATSSTPPSAATATGTPSMATPVSSATTSTAPLSGTPATGPPPRVAPRKSSSTPAAVWIIGGLAVLAVGAGLGVWAYQRNRI